MSTKPTSSSQARIKKMQTEFEHAASTAMGYQTLNEKLQGELMKIHDAYSALEAGANMDEKIEDDDEGAEGEEKDGGVRRTVWSVEEPSVVRNDSQLFGADGGTHLLRDHVISLRFGMERQLLLVFNTCQILISCPHFR